MQFNNTHLVLEQNNYASRILNVYIVSDLHNLPKYLLRNLTPKSCLFGATNIVKSNEKEQVYV